MNNSNRPNRTHQFTTILSILKEVLVDGLPIPPLMEIVTGYAIDQPFVSTWFSKNDGYPHFSPTSIAVMSTQPLTFLAITSEKICKCDAASGKISLFVDNVQSPREVFVDPNNGRIFVTQSTSISLIEHGVTSVVVGSKTYGYQEGVGPEALMDCPTGMALSKNGKTLIFCDTSNQSIRDVDLSTGQTSLICGRQNGFVVEGPRNCVWNRSTFEPQSELFITTKTKILRLHVKTRQLTTLKVDKIFNSWGFGQLLSGLLILPCLNSKCIYSVDPSNGAVVRLAGLFASGSTYGITNGDPLTEATFNSPSDCVVIDNESCIAVVDYNSECIRKVPLP